MVDPRATSRPEASRIATVSGTRLERRPSFAIRALTEMLAALSLIPVASA